MSRIKNLPSHQRPREKLIERGPHALTDPELLAILLRVGIKGKSAVELAKHIFKHRPLNTLAKTSVQDLTTVKGLGGAKAAQLVAAFELAHRANEQPSELPLINAERVINLLSHLKRKQKEHFVALYLDARHHLLHQETISVGHLTASLVHPREVYKPALEHSAVSIIVAHNHPSNNPQPSQKDILITQRLAQAGTILDIQLLDHLIITQDHWSSLKELGHIT